MQVQLNTNSSVEGVAGLAVEVDSAVQAALVRYAERITRVEVHLSDENAGRGGADDKRCVMEVRLTGMQPIAVTHQAGTVTDAVGGAVDKLQRSLESTLGRLKEHRS